VQVVKEHQCQYAVRGGGHGNHAGVSSIQDGLLIDLGRLNAVTVSDDESTAMIGAGSRWKEVYAVLEERGLLVVGGRSETVGVAGFTLGGCFYQIGGRGRS
jgi:FAD/FMN-containing dehydrogenase